MDLLQCGPAQLGREMTDAKLSLALAQARFNAARPNWAGKFGRRPGLRLAARAASMRPGPIGPGNASARAHVPDRLVAASMRPGPIGPGNHAKGAAVAGRSQGFNAARPNWAGK